MDRPASLHRLFAVASTLAGALFPRTCPLCSAWLAREEGAGRPCGRCESALGLLRVDGGSACPACGGFAAAAGERCQRCAADPRAFDSHASLLEYAGLAKAAILAWKFGKREGLSDYFAGMLAEALERDASGVAVVPVPPRAGKLRATGFDQVESLARRLEARGIAVSRLLAREDSKPQKALLSGAGRRSSGLAIRLARPGAAVPAVAALIDDVRTTGWTLSACAAVLKAAGAERVLAFTLARD